MTANLFLAIGFVGFVLSTTIAIYFWRRSSGLYSLLVEGADRFEELRNSNKRMQEAGVALETQLKRERRGKANLEAGIDEARAKSSELTQKLEIKDHELAIINNKFDLEKNGLDQKMAQQAAQTEAYQAQLQAANEQTEALKIHNKLQIEELEAQLEAASNSAKKLETQLETVDISTVKTAKRKANQMERLYNSMKGLKEMSDERNTNWEAALRVLSKWIVQNHGGESKDIPLAIGPLLAKALQITGNQLIEDSEFEHGDVRAQGASKAANMEEETSIEIKTPDASDETIAIVTDKLEAEKTD